MRNSVDFLKNLTAHSKSLDKSEGRTSPTNFTDQMKGAIMSPMEKRNSDNMLFNNS